MPVLIPPTAIVDVERMVDKFRPLEGDPIVRVILAALLANRFARPTWLCAIGPHASDVVALLGQWRFAVIPETHAQTRLRASQRRARRAIILPDLRRTVSADGGAYALVNRVLLELDTACITGGLDTTPRVQALPFIVYRCGNGTPLDDLAMAEREHYAAAAGRAIARFLDAAFASVDESLELELDPAEVARLAALDRMARWMAECATDRTHDQLPIVVRTLAFVAGRRAVTEHDYRLGRAIALSRVNPAALHLVSVLLEHDSARRAELRTRKGGISYAMRPLIRSGVVLATGDAKHRAYELSEGFRDLAREAMR